MSAKDPVCPKCGSTHVSIAEEYVATTFSEVRDGRIVDEFSDHASGRYTGKGHVDCCSCSHRWNPNSLNLQRMLKSVKVAS